MGTLTQPLTSENIRRYREIERRKKRNSSKT
jgi:hypothetical protein